MKEIGIIFSTPMVQATLENRKFMTRRVCKDIADHDFKWGLDREPYVGNYQVFTKTGPRKWDWITLENQWLYDLQTAVDDSRTYLLKCPYGQKGDRLYVKETWKVISVDDSKQSMVITYKAVQDGCVRAEIEVKFSPERYAQFRKFYQKNGWQSPYFMPKEAARLWLDNEGVRVERLQDITVEDVISEGLEVDNEIKNPDPSTHDSIKNWNLAWAQHVFRELWDKLNAKRGYGWDRNDWLWVVGFRRDWRE